VGDGLAPCFSYYVSDYQYVQRLCHFLGVEWDLAATWRIPPIVFRG
jgi:hypothetical protein